MANNEADFSHSVRDGVKVRPFRSGKTKKDKQSGAHARRLTNRDKRAAWSRGDEDVFPSETCNGKKNSRYTTS